MAPSGRAPRRPRPPSPGRLEGARGAIGGAVHRSPSLASFGARTRRAYLVALVLTGLLSLAAFAALDGFISAQDDAAAIINVAGRQRMLSQRIAGLANALWHDASSVGNGGAVARDRKLLAEAIVQMRSAHDGLMRGNAARNLPGIASAAERALYEEGPHRVDARLKVFLDDAARVLADPASQAASRAVQRMGVAARADLLAALHAVVQFHEEQARDATARAQAIHLAILITTLLVLLIEGLVIFRPLVRDLVRTEGALRTKQGQLEHQSRHDALTDLLNRRGLYERFKDEGAALRDPLGAILFDLDRFKAFNDTRGHGAGDALLRAVGEALVGAKRVEDIAVRLGGDEFAVLVPLPTNGDAQAAERLAGAMSRRLFHNVTLALQDLSPDVTASAGLALAPQHAGSLDELLANADIALYRAKADGRGRLRRFSRDLREHHDRRLAEEALIREALENDAFEPHFQPQVDLATGRVVGVEALARCRDRDGRLVPPSAFLQAAEEANLIVPLGRMVIAKAIAAAASWRAQDVGRLESLGRPESLGHAESVGRPKSVARAGAAHGSRTMPRLAVNASAAQLRDTDFARFLLATLCEHGLPAEALAVEVLETVVLEDDDNLITRTCAELREAGVRLELDDFGTGYASIANVERLGVGRIKIDRSILAHDPTGGRDLLRAIVTMAEGLGVDVVAEGVETSEHCERLVALGCTVAQGYHFARPMDGRAFADWIARFGASSGGGTAGAAASAA